MKATVQKPSYRRLTSLIAFAAILSTVAIACSKGGGGDPAPGPAPFGFFNPAIAPNCGGCPGSGGFLAAGISRTADFSFGPIEMGLGFFGDPMILQQMQGYQMGGYQQGFFGVFPQTAYRGPFSARGYLILPMGLPLCGLPPGRMNLETQSPGFWGNDGAGRSGENITLIVTGAPVPTMIYLSGYTMPLTPPLRGQDGNTYPYSFTTTQMVVKRADGPMCQLYLN